MNISPKISRVLHTRKDVNNKSRVQIRITFRGERRHYSTDLKFTRAEFKEIQGKSKPRYFKKADIQRINKQLDDVAEEYKRIIDEMSVFTFDLFQNELDKMEEKYSLELFHLLEKEEKARRSLEQISSANQYKAAKRSIKKLLGREEILMIDVTPSLLRDYEAEARKNNLSSTTINMYLRTVRYVFNYCINNGYLDRTLYPFGKREPKYVLPKGNVREMALEVSDMEIFKNARPEIGKNGKGKNDQFYLDLFLFSYYTFGMNIIDILLLTKGMVYNDFIDTARTKTKIHNPMNLKLPIRPETQKIMDKYMSDKSEFIFGVLKGNETTTQLKERSKAYVKRINRVLKAICKKHNISKHVTTYTARHTAANQLLAGDVPVAKISQLLGHKDIKTTQNYLSRLPDYNIQKEVMKVAM
jgi:integrase